MPTYEYRCKACEREFEVFQSMKDNPKRTCPECGKRALERLIGSGAAIIFKGSGFYQTDYRSESYKKAAEKDKPADGKPDKDEKKTKTPTETPTGKTRTKSETMSPDKTAKGGK